MSEQLSLGDFEDAVHAHHALADAQFVLGAHWGCQLNHVSSKSGPLRPVKKQVLKLIREISCQKKRSYTCSRLAKYRIG